MLRHARTSPRQSSASTHSSTHKACHAQQHTSNAPRASLWCDVRIPGDVPLNVATSRPDAAGTPLILVHGITATSRHWNSFARGFPDSPPLYALDLRGRGQSGKGGCGGLRTHVNDIERVMEHFNLPRAVIVGHSLGGYIALESARVLGSRCAGYVVVDSGHPADWGSPVSSDPRVTLALEHAFRRLSMRFTDRNAYLRYWFPELSRPAETLPTDWVDAFEYELVPDGDGTFRVSVDEASIKADAAELPHSRMTTDDLSKLSQPSLLVIAEHGFTDDAPPFVDSSAADMLHKALKSTHPVRHVPGSNHYTILTQPAYATALVHHVSAWLADI